MFQKVHFKLTLLFTGITSFILIVMSFCYIYLSENNLSSNQFLSFQRDMNTVLTNLEQQTIITHEWLSKIESNGNYSIFILDNGTEFLYQNKEHNTLKSKLFHNVIEYYNAHHKEEENISALTAYHKEYEYQDTSITMQSYFVCSAVIPKQSGSLEVTILYSLKNLEKQIIQQRIVFIFINLVCISILFIFAYYFTKVLLKPIEKSQKKQAEFIASASHELRTPLAVLLSSLNACRKANQEEQENFFHIMEGEGKRMSNLIQDMLTLANADNRTWKIQCVDTELDTLILDTYEAFWPIAKEKNRRLSVSLPDYSVPNCYCDIERIKQVLAILLNNAISYTHEKGEINLQLSMSDKYFEIFVSDNGIGIPDSDKNKIFQRFYRADSSRNKKNHFGLGLCIAAEIIHAHQGSITVSDNPGGGSRFQICLKRKY